MRTVVCLAGAAILLVAVATRVSAQECPNLTGCWAGDYAGDSSGTATLFVVNTGNQLSGRLTVQDVNSGTLTGDLSGTIACDVVTLVTTFVTATGQVTGDCMSGTWFSSPLGGGGTWQDCRVACVCGNGVIEPGEGCDDGSTAAGDGCSDGCTVEPGFECVGEPSVCVAVVCGNGFIQSGEECDDGNTDPGDGCSDTCAVEPGFTCFGQPSACIPIVCGNGVLQPGETCDDGNTDPGDCCRPDCTTDPEGTGCVTPELPGTCDASGNCVAIPTLSEWGAGLLSLLMLAAVLRHRPRGMGSGVR